MHDVIAIALITAGSSLAAAAVGATTTARVSRRNAEANISAAKSQAEVELAKVEAENTRLRAQHTEDERRNRQGTYHQMIALVNELLWADRRQIKDLLNKWYFINAGVALLAPSDVVERARELSKILAGGVDRADDAWRERSVEAARQVLSAMRKDIGSGELPPIQVER